MDFKKGNVTWTLRSLPPCVLPGKEGYGGDCFLMLFNPLLPVAQPSPPAIAEYTRASPTSSDGLTR